VFLDEKYIFGHGGYQLMTKKQKEIFMKIIQKKLLSRYQQFLDLYKSIDDYLQEQSKLSTTTTTTVTMLSQELIDGIVKYLNEYEAS
jgi:ABC-type transporter MlaC component